MFDRFFRRTPPYQLPLAMIGVKTGDVVLVCGTRRPGLIAEVARITGLNGRTLAVGPPETRDGVEAAAAEAGSLLEFESDSQTAFRVTDVDLAVWDVELGMLDDASMALTARQLVGCLRPGGRLVILDGHADRRRKDGPPHPVSEPTVLALLAAAGTVANRALASADGITYYEGRRPART
jgi:hypothetical protein